MRIKKITLVMLLVLTSVSTFACTKSNNNLKAVYQKEIARVDQFRSELPENYEIIDFKSKALAYDQLVFDFEKTGALFPLIWADDRYDSYGISAYVGDYRNGVNGSQEAVTAIASVLSATLLGLDKSNQNGYNFVSPLNVYFNTTEQVVINNPSGNSRNISMWYMIYPAILFTQVSILYEDEALLRTNTLKTIESWYQAYLVMHNLNDYDFTGFDFESMQPYRNNVWREPDSAVGISMLMYYGYHLTGDTKYKTAAIESLMYIENKYTGSSMYEILLYFGPYLAAKYNQEFGTSFDVNRFFNAVFNGNSIPRGGWGMLNDNYNGFAVSGLMGSITDGGGYAFSMNTFASAFILARTAKYDTRYAASIGKWLNHLISNSRYFFPNYAKDENESMFNSEYASEAQAFNALANNVFPYEGIRKSGNNKSPWFGGDPTVYNWAKTDFSVYSGASMGMLGALYEKTNVNGILKIDLNTGDYYNQSVPTYLLYNPNTKSETVRYTVSNPSSLYDAVTEKILVPNVTGTYDLVLEAGQAVVIMELAPNANIQRTGNLTKLGDVVLSHSQVSLNVLNYANNAEVPKNFKLELATVFNNDTDTVDYYEVVMDGKTTQYINSTLNLQGNSGSKSIIIRVYTKSGAFDQITLRVRIL